MSILTRLRGFASKHKVMTVLLCVVLVLIVFLSIKALIDAPRDLGPRLEYIGRQDEGNIFGFDQYPSSDYYFATDMNSDELKTYFKGAKYIPGWPASIEGYGTTYLDFTNTYNHEEFNLTISENDPLNTKELGFRATNKPYIVMITDTDYGVARQSL